MPARPQYLLSTVCIGQSLSLSLDERRLLEITKIVSPRTKDRKRFFFFYLFLLFFARGWLVVKWAASSNPITGFTSFTREFIMAAINRQWDKRDFFHGSYNRFDEGKDDEADRRESGRSFRLFQSSSCATRFLFFFFFNRGEKGNSGGWHSATTSGALMGVNAMCKRAIAPTALFCSPLPFFSLVRPIHPPGNSMPLTCPVAAGKKKGGAGGGRAIEEGRRQGWRGARATTRAQEVSPLSG